MLKYLTYILKCTIILRYRILTLEHFSAFTWWFLSHSLLPDNHYSELCVNSSLFCITVLPHMYVSLNITLFVTAFDLSEWVESNVYFSDLFCSALLLRFICRDAGRFHSLSWLYSILHKIYHNLSIQVSMNIEIILNFFTVINKVAMNIHSFLNMFPAVHIQVSLGQWYSKRVVL